MQHIENLFRRCKGRLINVKTISGGVYVGRVGEVTNDYVTVTETKNGETSEVYLFFHAIESMMLAEVPIK